MASSPIEEMRYAEQRRSVLLSAALTDPDAPALRGELERETYDLAGFAVSRREWDATVRAVETMPADWNLHRSLMYAGLCLAYATCTVLLEPYIDWGNPQTMKPWLWFTRGLLVASLGCFACAMRELKKWLEANTPPDQMRAACEEAARDYKTAVSETYAALLKENTRVLANVHGAKAEGDE